MTSYQTRDQLESAILAKSVALHKPGDFISKDAFAKAVAQSLVEQVDALSEEELKLIQTQQGNLRWSGIIGALAEGSAARRYLKTIT